MSACGVALVRIFFGELAAARFYPRRASRPRTGSAIATKNTPPKGQFSHFFSE